MKNKILIALAIVSLVFFSQPGVAQEKSPAAAELKAVMTKVQAKMKEHKTTEADLADELKELDALLAKYKGDDAAQVLYTKSMIYTQVLRNKEKGAELMAELKKDFPDSKLVTNIKKSEEKQAEAKKVQDSLAVGTKFPDFNEKDLMGKPLSVANYKGKVVLIDFWATWCPPCRAEVPNVVAVYNKHHSKGFDIIGISLDRQQDKAKLESYTKENKMPWQQFFDGQYWSNKLAAKYGVNSIPATYLIDGQGMIIGKNLRGDALEEAVAKALAKS